MNSHSITGRLIVTMLLIQLVAAVGVAGVAFAFERHAHFRAFDVLLRGRADSLLGAVQDAEDAKDNVMLDGTEVTAPADDLYEVADSFGRILGRSPNWEGLAADDQGARLHWKTHDPRDGSFLQREIGGKEYRIIRIQGTRIVDPGDKGGGIPRAVTIYYGSSVKRVWEAVLRTVGFYAASSVAVLALTGILMTWLLNRGLAPLRELAAGASRVSVHSWSFQPPESARMTRELAPLVAALESLLFGLRQSFERQQRFVGDAAHELKTGVAVVKSSLQLLGMKQRTPAEYEAGIERCLTDCERMEAIVAQMLTLARLEEEIAVLPTSVRTPYLPCVQEVAKTLATMAQTRGIALDIHAEERVIASVEPESFKLVCSNLLMNALQHSAPGATVTVALSANDGFATMTIRDRGEGIPAEDLPRIFERFFRSDPSRSRKTGGTGLGLAICKAVALKYNGRLEIESVLGVGTTVTTCFPLDAVEEAAALQ